MHWSVPAIGYKSRAGRALSFRLSTQNLKVASFFGVNTSGETHLVSAGSITFIASMFSVANRPGSCGFDPARYSTKFESRMARYSSSTRFFMVEIRPSCFSHSYWKGINMTINLSQTFEYLSVTAIDLCQSRCFSFRKVKTDSSSSMLAVLTTLGSDWSSWAVFCGAPKPTVVDISSFRSPSTLNFSEHCCFVLGLVTWIKIARLGKALIMSFASRCPWVTRLPSWTKRRMSFDLVVIKIFVTNSGSSNFCLATPALLEYFIDHSSSLLSKRRFRSRIAYCVLKRRH